MKQQEQLTRLRARETGSPELLTKSSVAPWEVVRDFIDSLKSTARGEEAAQQRPQETRHEAEKKDSQSDILERRERREKACENKRYIVNAQPAIGKILLDTSMSPIKRGTQR